MVCDRPEDFDAKGESTLTKCLACIRSRLCAYKIATTKEETLALFRLALDEANFSAWLAAFEATKLSKKSDKQPVDRRFFSA